MVWERKRKRTLPRIRERRRKEEEEENIRRIRRGVWMRMSASLVIQKDKVDRAEGTEDYESEG